MKLISLLVAAAVIGLLFLVGASSRIVHFPVALPVFAIALMGIVGMARVRTKRTKADLSASVPDNIFPAQ
ncbi:MAG TPA: hypothetical protein VN809_03305 [Telmatospirillum sp.]|nr:hypothetical protein [Telmatospirillum sp.]